MANGGEGTGQVSVEKQVAALSDLVAELTSEVGAMANRVRLGIGHAQAPAQTASASVVTGTTAVSWAIGLVGVFAIVIAVSCVAVVAAWRDADSRVFEAQSRMQAERNETIEDRLGIAEAQLRRINREAAQQ